MRTTVLTTLFLLHCIAVRSAHARYFSIKGHVTHGTNIFNDQPLVDFSSVSKIFSTVGPLAEVGALNPGGANATRITKSTPRWTRLATLDSNDLQSKFGLPQGAGPFNVPIADTPTLFFGSRDVNDRKRPLAFAATKDPYTVGLPHRSTGADADIRLHEWNVASVRISGRCGPDGTAVVRVRVWNALPNALYSVADVGVHDALTDKERPYVSPFGGLPNVITTDEHGKGVMRRRLNYCPTERCRKGSKRCTMFVELFYHFDHAIYGASPALDAAGPAIGNVGSIHMSVFFNGKMLRDEKKRYSWK